MSDLEVNGEQREELARAFHENARLLLRLRWVAILGQLVTIAVARIALHVELALFQLLAIVGITAFTNLIFSVWVGRIARDSDARIARTRGSWAIAGVMILDLLALTGLLYFAGGAANPFSIFYLVNLTLCAMLLPEGLGVFLALAAGLCLTLLFVYNWPIPELHRHAGLTELSSWGELSLEQWGRAVAMVGCALVIVHFVASLTRQLNHTAMELRRMEQDRLRSEKLEALGTLAAGAAHELATPLSTIAIVANEMTRHLHQRDLPPSVQEDMALIRTEVGHCQTILRRMRAHAGQGVGEKIETVSLHDFVHSTINELTDAACVRLRMAGDAADVQLTVPTESLSQAVRGLLQNAIDATQPQPAVTWTVEWDASRIYWIVRDAGPGMSVEASRRAGEPFFTTKEPGRGMGLGLFLARSVIERLGGRLSLTSTVGEGVTARVELPRAHPGRA